MTRSLRDLLGKAHVRRVSAAARWLGLPSAVDELGQRPVDFYPAALQARLASLLEHVGRRVLDAPPLLRPTPAREATASTPPPMPMPPPLSALGYYRIGEDGRLYLTTKSEHYHASVGHGFPGYRLIEHARALGLPNATHNNTRARSPAGWNASWSGRPTG